MMRVVRILALALVLAAPALAAETPPGPLGELSWLIGRWVDVDERATIVTEYAWTANRAFLSSSFTLRTRDGVELAGTQVIGWDPTAGVIRSWIFDSRVAWWATDSRRWVMEASLHDLDQDETSVRVHFGRDQTQEWTLVRVEPPAS